MEVKEKPLKESGSCPQIGRQSFPRSEISNNRSSTYLNQLLKSETRKMRRPNRVGAKRVCHYETELLDKSLRQLLLPPPPPDLLIQGKPLVQNLYLPCGDYTSPLLCSSKPSTQSSGIQSAGDIEKRHIDVIVRIRPKSEREKINKTIVFKTSDTSLIFDPKEKDTDFFYKGKRQVLRNDFGKKRPNKNLPFAFDYVYGQESTNQEMFEISLKGLINKVLDGFNCTVFAYGATGSGKTYTMLGSSVRGNPGITVLMAEELYRKLKDMESDEFTHDIKVSYLEVYNETIKDLLNPSTELSIREDGKQGLRIPGLRVHKPSGAKELLRLLEDGNNARSQHATDFNSESSRSHAVLQISVLMHQHSPFDRFKKRTAKSRLVMVDLAGSEKGSVNNVDGMRQREGANINKSLLALSNCINALADGKTHIPYRDSKLTRLLKDSLSGNCVTVMIANVSPTENTFEDTHNTLHYANRAKHIKVTCKQNAYSEELIEEAACNGKISDLQNEVLMLTQKLAEERRKHQKTRELLGCQALEGEGDGFGDVIQICQQRKHEDKSSPVIHDPVAVDRLVELMKQKTELMTSLTEASVNVRLHEWEMNWRKFQVDFAEYVGRPAVSDPQFITITKLMNKQNDLAATFSAISDSANEKYKNLKDINSEIGTIHGKCLKTLKQDAPFLTMSFGEFVSYQQMDMESQTKEKLVKFHQQREQTLYAELKNSEIHRMELIKFLQKLEKKKMLTKDVEKTYKTLLMPVYDIDTPLEPPKTKKKFNIQEDLTNLNKTIQRPLINFPTNEPIFVASSLMLIPQKESSEILPTTAHSGFIPNEETSDKDSSDEGHHQQKEDESLGFHNVTFTMPSSQTICNDNSSSNLDSIPEEECDFLGLSENINNNERKKPLNLATSSVQKFGHLFNENENGKDVIKQRGKETRTKTKKGTLKYLKQTKAVTDITATKSCTSFDTRCTKKEGKNDTADCIRKFGSNIPKRIQFSRNCKRPCTFAYEDEARLTSASSFEGN